MKAEDIRLTKEQVTEKYPHGSPDYPNHPKCCPCSGCYASWGEWRGAHQGYEVARADVVDLREALKDRIELVERLMLTLGKSVQEDIRRDHAELRKKLGLEASNG